MSYVFGEPPAIVRFWNYYLEIKYFDDSNTIQTLYQSVAAKFDDCISTLDEMFDKGVEDLRSGKVPLDIEGEIVSGNRIYSVTPYKVSQEYNVTPH